MRPTSEIRTWGTPEVETFDGPGSLSKTGAAWQTACKPNSVEDGHSSRPRIAARAQATYPEVSAGPGNRIRSHVGAPGRHASAAARAGLRISPLFGLAPCGVYHASAVTVGAVRSYRTFSPLPSPFRSMLFQLSAQDELSPERRGGMFSVALAVSRP
jgi:hypothetical protein